jgi:hypothetical protein
MNPSMQRWNLSIKSHLISDARSIIVNLKDSLMDTYGPEIEHFFIRDQTDNKPWRSALVNNVQEEEDNWFDDEENEIEIMIEKGLLDSEFLSYLQSKGDDTDKQSVLSWGTGETAYTEIVASQITNDTSTSSLTNDSLLITPEERKRRIALVKDNLLKQGITDEEFEDIQSNKTPYELPFSGIHLPSWDEGKEVFLIPTQTK